MRKFALITLMAVALAGPAFADEWAQSYEVGSSPRLNIKTHDANIFVTGDSNGAIEISIITKGIDLGEDGLVITESQSGDSVTLELKPAHRNSWGRGYSAEVEIRVPRGTQLDLHTGDGDIDLRSLAANAKLATGDGDISVKDMQGELTTSTGDGDISTAEVSGTLTASTGDGDVKVSGQFDEVDIHTGDGQVNLVALEGSEMRGSWSVRTGDGEVTLNLPANLEADVDLHTGDGRIDLEMPVTVSGRAGKRIQGSINGGGELLHVKTGDGSITLKPLS